MKSCPRKPFYLVRHGESFANRFEYPSGRMDTRLTRLGWDQAREAALIATRLDEKPTVVVASALVRARETAKLIQDQVWIARLKSTAIWVRAASAALQRVAGAAGPAG